MSDLNLQLPPLEVSEGINMLDELDKILEELSSTATPSENPYRPDNVEGSRLSYSQWQQLGYQVMKGERAVKRLKGGIYLFDYCQVKPI